MPEYDRQGFVFGSVNTQDYGIWVSGEGTFGSTKRDVESVKIAGKNGTLKLDNGRYENITVSYPCYLLSGFGDTFNAFRDALMHELGYQVLADTFHPEEFRIGEFNGSLSPTMGAFVNGGLWTVSFDCKPQRFLISGTRWLNVADGEVLHNPANGKAKPVIRVTGSGTVGIGNEMLTIAENSYPYIDIDCELQDCFYESINCNSLVSVTDFPVLGKDTGITFTVDEVQIMPRWFRL